jgi:hypothetical protein
MNHPDDEGQPTFVPEDTRELSVGEEIENGDLKWHQAACRWAEIQKLGYRIVKASQKGLYRRYATAEPAENEPNAPAPGETRESAPRV